MRVPRPQPHLEEVLASEPGPHIAALFDFDGTIISGYSATAMLREKFQRREMSVEEIAETANVLAQHSLGSIGFSGLMTGRSEEHTSELQSLMRISYAVFCLKKKKRQTIQTDVIEYRH